MYGLSLAQFPGLTNFSSVKYVICISKFGDALANGLLLVGNTHWIIGCEFLAPFRRVDIADVSWTISTARGVCRGKSNVGRSELVKDGG